jgi:FKBP-type peptidyl-prolyl cis-trans isomerase FkpA
MAAGTILTYVVVIVANGNTNANPTQIAYDKYMNAQNSTTNSTTDTTTCEKSGKGQQSDLDSYKAAAFDKSSVGSTTTATTLAEGSGDPTTSEQCIDVEYKGWNTKGVVFDSGEYAFVPSKGGVITGWVNSLVGKKIGGTYKLVIPSAEAYGSTGSGDNIPADEPLTFVVKIISAS